MRFVCIAVIALTVTLQSCTDETIVIPSGENGADALEINILRYMWYESSPPVNPVTEQLESAADRAEQCWYNPHPDQHYLGLYSCDLDPACDSKSDRLLSLMISIIEPAPEQWCGIMHGFPEGLDLSRAQYLEIWINDFQPDSLLRWGTVHIEFGLIDEDFHQPDSNRFDDEDQWPYGWTHEEDTGFEGEDCRFPIDIIFNPEYYIYEDINCRVENWMWDTEDLNRNGYLDVTNAYYHVEIDLAAEAVVDIQRDYSKVKYADYWYAVDRSNYVKAWRLYRIDRAELFARLISPDGPAPRLDAIQHMRIWISKPHDIDGMRGSLVQIGLIRFVNE